MSGKAVTPETRLLAAQVRLGEPKAIKRVISELKRAKGNVSATAAALGVSERTLYVWRDVNAEFKAAFDENVRGLGRPPLPKKKAAKKTKRADADQ
jgi:transposase-like protein